MIMSWNSTNKCNMFCDHCYRESGEEAMGELNTAEAKKLIEEVAAANFKIMIFSGGEPLMREDIFELIAYAKSQGLRPVLGTNGSLITLEVAEKLKNAGAMGVGISLDSLDIAKHNQLRKLDRAWEMAVEGMANCKKVNLPFQIHTTVMDWNQHEVEKLTDFAVEKGAVAHHIFFLVPTGRGENIEDKALKRDEYENLLVRIMKKAKTVNIEIKPTCAPQFMRIAQQLDMKLRYSKGCIAGTAYCIISPKGDVQPCAYMKMEIANVRDLPFDEIWRNNEVFKTLRTAKYEGVCGDCNFANKCGGCRARAAYYHQGNYMHDDPLCIMSKDAYGKKQNEVGE